MSSSSKKRARDDIIKLNVGGRHFDTTRDTLVRSSPYFQRLLDEERFLSAADDEGRVFIDRDGDVFSIMLSFMRSSITDVPPGVDVHRVAAEAEYFGLELNQLELRRRDPAQSDVVELNVGGRVFFTCRKTLEQSPTLAKVLKRMDKGKAIHDSNGRLFLDRNADTFELILQLLQGYYQAEDSEGLTWAGVESWTRLDMLRDDVQYYGIADWAINFTDNDGAEDGDEELSLSEIIMRVQRRRQNASRAAGVKLAACCNEYSGGDRSLFVYTGAEMRHYRVDINHENVEPAQWAVNDAHTVHGEHVS